MNYDGLDDEPLRNLLRQFTYKPNWTFVIQDDMLIIRLLAPDTDNIKNIIPVHNAVTIPRFVVTSFSWHSWLLEQIMCTERHEAQEFFKINGVKVFDPHG
jgi:hypothetical protein